MAHRGGIFYRLANRFPRSSFAVVPILATSASYGALQFTYWALDLQDKSVQGRPQMSMPARVYNANKADFVTLVKVVPYGVLGTQLQDGKVVTVSKEPEADGKIVIVDPAGLHHIQHLPKGAGGAAGAIYKWLASDLPPEKPFPDVVREGITAPTHAQRYIYSGKPVIHAVGPDLRNKKYDEFSARRDLALTYKSILEQYALHMNPDLEAWRPRQEYDNERTPWCTLRLLPVSGGIFSGPFAKDMPRLTMDALVSAFDDLDRSKRRAIMCGSSGIELCIFDGAQQESFTAAFMKKLNEIDNWKKEQTDSVYSRL
eukprot:Sspe_Gene.43670::Locus_21319_Transcript_1_1_Confidence_1.000_Length_2660::g.43670::m.43670